jgi:hypothetical protein
MDYLRQIDSPWPLFAPWIQEQLWGTYAATGGFNFGISAMPSLHVTVATLIALVARRTNRPLGAVLTIYAGVVVIGSVHLAWHYAVDALAGVALGLSFWVVAGLVVRNLEQVPLTRRAALLPAGMSATARD